jgi:5'-nucleotidase
VVRQGKRKLGDDLYVRDDPRGQPYFWVGGQRTEDRGVPGTDLEAVHRNAVTVTPLCVDFTSVMAMERLTTVFP